MATTNTDTVQKAYIAFYGRPGDPSGLAAWEDNLTANGGNLGGLMTSFGSGAEATALYGNKTHKELVHAIYNNLFGRDADETGETLYVGHLDNGTLSAGSIAFTILQGVRPGTLDFDMIANKLIVANAFTTGLDTEEEIDGFSGNVAAGSAREMLATVNAATDAETFDVDTTIAAITAAVSTSESVVISEAAVSSPLTVTTHSDSGYELLTRKIDVFGIGIYAADSVAESKLIHAAHVLAEYLDNDEDGLVDNQLVVDAMIASKATIGLWKNEGDLDVITEGQRRYTMDLGDIETRPEWHINNQPTAFDASLEEILHSITENGYALAYPEIFGERIGTSVADAMDVARGGQFTEIPEQYPESAWYSYKDSSCDYKCMITEYMYWGLSSILGAQASRLDVIGQEWKLNTAELVETNDPTLYNLLTDDQYKFPTHLPDGSYAYAG